MSTHSRTAEIELAGSALLTGDQTAEAARLADEFAVPRETAEHLLQSYGGNGVAVLELTRRREALKSRLIADLPHIEAEVVYAARHEMAVTVEDFLARRTRIRLLTRDGGASGVARVTQLLAEEN